jgi:menaquinol-cytochrome c reductase iron-sulfur subunit
MVVAGLATAIGLALALPSAAFLLFPARRRVVYGGDEPLDVGLLDALPDGKPTRVTLTAPLRRDAWTAFADVPLGACWLLRQGGEVRALSTVCPHAGCSIDWNEAKGQFGCPCHDSAFAKSGERVKGPAPRGMDALEVAVQKGRVSVLFRRFKTGAAGKEPLG